MALVVQVLELARPGERAGRRHAAQAGRVLGGAAAAGAEGIESQAIRGGRRVAACTAHPAVERASAVVECELTTSEEVEEGGTRTEGHLGALDPIGELDNRQRV